MSSLASFPLPTTVLTAASTRPLRARPKRTPSFSRNNYLADLSAEARRAKAEAEPPGGRGCDFSGNNFVAEPKKRGAKPGNRNARKHGRYGAKRLAANRALRAYLRGINTLCRDIGRMVNVDRAEIDRRIVALISPRGVVLEWLTEDDPRTPLPLRHDPA